jgi:hypothetical protein
MVPCAISFVITEDFPRLSFSVSVVNSYETECGSISISTSEFTTETECGSLGKSSVITNETECGSISLSTSEFTTETENESLGKSSVITNEIAPTFSFICNY